MTFQSIVRQWCKEYKPMQDAPTNKRFFMTDYTGGVIDLAKGGISEKSSPCVVMESSIEGGGPFTKPNRNYPIYFFVKAKKANDGELAALAKEEAWKHAQNFLTWLRHKHEKETERNLRGDFARIDIENISLDITTVGPLENAWYAVLIQLEREEPLGLCVDPDLYLNEDCCNGEERGED